MNYFSFPKLLIFSATLLIGYSSFSQAVFIDSSGITPKYKKVKKPGGRMTDFQSAMEFEFNMIKNPVSGKVPEGSFTQELEQAKAILADQQKNNVSNVGTPYAFQGPNNLGGRTRTLAYDVRYNGTTNRIILAGGVSGGVYKSIDDGATWVRKSPTGVHFSCTSIAQDTRPGFEDIWYYGVGESSGNSASGSGATYFGNGVYKSTDNGETWARLTTSNTSALESFSTGADAIQKVIVDPTDGYVYVACLAKIMRSVDGGTTWVDVLPGVLGFSSQTTDIVVSATGRLYASFGGTNDSGVDGVWASAPGPTSGDPGSWTRIAGAGAGGSPVGWNPEGPSGTPGAYGRVVLAIPPSAPTLLYALYWNNVSYTCGAPSPEAELFRWDDVATTWTNLSATLPDEAGCLAGNDPFAAQGGYDLVIAVKPDAAGTLFLGGTNAYRSTDAGLTWTRIGGYATSGGYALYAGSHPDIHSFVFQPGSPLIMLCGNDGGIQRTTDNLAGTVAWTPINTGYRTYQYYHVTVDPRVGNTKVLGGTQDNGTSRNVGGVGTTHEGVFGGDGVSVGLSDLIGGIQYEYVGFQFGEIFRRDATSGAGFGTYIIPPGESGTGLFVTLFKLDVDNSEILYYANDNKLYRTTSASTVTSGTWTDMTGIGTGVGAANDITAIATTRGTYSAATASLFLGTNNGRMFRLDNPAGVAAGTGPVEISLGAGFPAVGSGNISSIAVNPRNDDTLVVTFSNYGVTSVYWTGTANSALPTWTAVEGALTLPSYRSSAIAVTAAGVEYFVGTSTGLYTSMGLPGAVAWTQEGATEIGNAVVSSLALRASDGKLLVGTHGYGMWETSLTTSATCTITLTSAPGTNAQTVCINTAITNITYSTTAGTVATFSGLPTGVTGAWAANVVTISGTPTAAGTFNYTVILTGGSCVFETATGSITVTPNNTITLTSAAGTNAQTVCISTAITSITYATTGATGATVTGLPAGVTGAWAANVVTISGTPTASGVFSYTVTLTGGCGTVTATGSITVTANNTVTLTSAAGTNAQTVAVSTTITTITYATIGATGATVTGLPAGVTGSWAANVVTISGTPTATGVFTYTVTLTGGCGTITATGTITVNPPTLETWELSAAAGSQASSAPATTAVNITAGVLSRGAGVTAAAAGGSISSSGWFNSAAATTLATAIANNEYYEFTLPVNAGFTADVTALAFYLRSSATGPNTATLRSSADGYASDLGTATAIPNAAASLYTLPVTLTGISGTLTFRLYGWGGASGGGTPSTGGTFRIGTSPTALADDLDIFGTTAAAGVCSATLTSAAGTNAQTVCISTAITPITYSTVGATGATFTGLPAGVTGSWAANVINISGTPTASGVFSYTATLTGGSCTVETATGTITVTANNTVTLTSAAGTNAQTVCISTAITSITYATTGATGATVTGLPAGVTGAWAANVVTISGTPTGAGVFSYTVTLTGGCGTITATGSITVTANNTITLTSAAGTNAQTVCIITAITSITYATTGATGATVTGLPAGVTGVWAANVVTISGTPTAAGVFGYTVTLTGGCGTITATGSITVTANNTVTLTSAAGTNAQTITLGSPITTITYATTGATGATVTGLPAGVTGLWAANVVTISGTPTATGLFGYTVTLAGGCGTITATGTITVNPPGNTITLTSAAGTNAQTVCISTAITSITYATTGATGATFSGLPAGVTGVWAANVVTVSGTPTAAGVFSYTVTLTGGSGTGTATGSITVTANNTVNLTSAASTNAQTVCISTAITSITYATTGATGATFSGLPAGVTGVWAANVVTISGTPTSAGIFGYTVTLTGGCGTVTATGSITVTANNTVTLTSAAGTNAQTVCISTAITSITYATTGATGATVTGLPAGVTGVWAANVVTISGTPTAAGLFGYTITLTGGCGTVTATGSITVTANNTVTLTSAAGTNAQTVAISTPITSITYATTGATGATVTGLPAGVTSVWAANVVTISGTPTVAGLFNYTVTLTGGCGTITATGSITVTGVCSAILTSAAGTNLQTVCVSTAITPITYSTVGSTGATFTGLPAGVTGNWAANTITISGTPTASGTFNYSALLTGGGCTTESVTGTINVNQLPDVTQPSNQVVCNNFPTAAVNFTGTIPGTVFNWTNNTPSIGLAASGTGDIASFTATNATTSPVVATVTVTPSFTTSSAGGLIPEVLYYKFDGSGTSVPNLASAPPAGTATASFMGGLTQGGSAICNGTSIGTGVSSSTDYLNTGWAPNLGTSSWTISFKSENITPSATLFYCMGDVNSNSFRCFTNGVAGPNNWILRGGGLTDVLLSGGATVAPHTNTFVYDNVANQVRAYLDGVLVSTVAQGAVNLTGAGPFKVNGYSTNVGAPLNGHYDEYKLFSRALTPAEVLSLNGCPSAVSTTCSGTPKTFTITVNPTPNAVATPASQTICSGATITTIALTSAVSGTTYNWTRNNTATVTGIAASGSGNISGSLTNTTNAPVTVTFTITPTANGCAGAVITSTVLVNPTPTAVATPASQTICSGSSITPIILTSANGILTVGLISSTWADEISLQLVDASSTPVISAGPFGFGVNYTSPAVPATNGPYTFNIEALGPAQDNFANWTINCNGNPIASGCIRGNTGPACGTATGTFSLPGITCLGGVAGTVYNWTRNNTATVTGIAASGSGTISGTLTNTTNAPITVTFTITPTANGCAGAPITATVLVNPTPNAVATPASQAVCSAFPITTIVMSGNVSGTIYNWTRDNTVTVTGMAASGSGNIIGSLINVTAAPITVTFTITPTANGCPGAPITATITVTPQPAATISYAGSPYCSTDLTAPVTRTGTAGGTYSAAPAGLTINATTGTVTPNTSTPGTYTVTYTVAPAGGCLVYTTTTTITITAAPNMIIFYAGTPYCSNAGTANVTRFGTAGGTYSAAPAGLTINAATGAVTLGTSTPGTYTVTYSVTLPGCGITNTTTTITITAAPNATISYAGSPYCSNAGTANVTFTGTAGGTYSSTAGLTLNAATGAVTLGSSTPGTYTVTYTVAASGGCATYTTTATITITALPTATIAYTGSPYCANAGTATVTRTGTAGGTYTAAPAGLSINAATGDVNLGASAAGTYTVTYTIAAGGGCPAVTATASITITTLPAATISYAGNPFCQPGGVVAVTRTGTAGGTYSAAPAGLSINATTGDINVTTSTPGTYTVTYTVAAGGGCGAVTATTSVTINSPSTAPTAANATVPALCGPGTVTLSVAGGSLGSGATWRWYSGSCGGTAVGTGATLNVTVNATTTYFVRAEGTCNTTACASVTVTVNTQPTISIVTSATTIKPGQPATITATVTPAAGNTITWFRNGVVVPGATGLTLVVAVSDFGTYTARVTTGAGCTALSGSVTILAESSIVVFVYPNPSRGQFQVRVYNQPGKQLTVLVHNARGQLVYNDRKVTSAPYTRMDVDMRSAAAGTYTVTVVDSDGEILGSKSIVIYR